MPTSLRGRLFVSYALLVMLSLGLAMGATLAVVQRSLERDAYRDMADRAVRLIDFLDGADSRFAVTPGLFPHMLRRGLGPGGHALVVDAEGRPVPRLSEAPPHVLAGLFPPAPLGAPDRPEVQSSQLEDGARLVYVSVPLPDRLAGEEEAWLVVTRTAREVGGLWRVFLGPLVGIGVLALVVASLIALALARSITHPLEDMTRASGRMAAGDFDVRVAGGGTDEVDRLAGAFNSMAREVGEAHRRQRDFVANVSHDLRTPLTAIRGFAGALVDGTADTGDEQRHAASVIDAHAARMEGLVETLIELARLEGRGVGLKTVETELGGLLEAVAANYGHAAEVRGIRIAVDAPSGLAMQVDPAWLGRALGNLVENAVRHSPEGGTIHLDGRATAEGGVEVVVADEGDGIAPGELARVFERFYRGDRARGGGGSGLGLSIAQEIVEGHGGSIDIASEAGSGTRATVRLPAHGLTDA